MNSIQKSFKSFSLFKSKPKVSSPINIQGVPADILANSKPINKTSKAKKAKGGKSRRRKNNRSIKRMTFRKTRVHR